jgi:hypothetical protein
VRACEWCPSVRKCDDRWACRLAQEGVLERRDTLLQSAHLMDTAAFDGLSREALARMC